MLHNHDLAHYLKPHYDDFQSLSILVSAIMIHTWNHYAAASLNHSALKSLGAERGCCAHVVYIEHLPLSSILSST